MAGNNMGPSSTSDINQWLADFFADADLVDVDKLVAWFADDIELRFANNPPINDKLTARQVMAEFYNSIAGMRHVPEEVVAGDNVISQQAIVTYTRHDGTDVPLPVSSYIRRNSNGLIDRLWIYIDITPLYEVAA